MSQFTIDSLLSIGYALVVLGIITWLVARTSKRVLGIQVSNWRALFVSALVCLLIWLVAPYINLFTDIANKVDASVPRLVIVSLGTVLGGFALGVLVLMVAEVVVPTGSLPSLRVLLLERGRIIARWRRWFEITWILTRHGLNAQLRGGLNHQQDEVSAEQVRKAMEAAGVTFIKLGQMLSTRGDLIPQPYLGELAKLTSQVEAQEFSRINSVLSSELGSLMSRLQIEEQCLAAASVAQVHGALLDGKKPVVVKVERAGAADQVLLDLDILESLAERLDQNADWAHSLGVLDIVRGFAVTLREELDYQIEVENMISMRAAMADTGIIVPKVYEEFCTDKVIVMSRLDGVPIAEAGELIAQLPARTRQESVQRLLGAVIDQILGEGVFHADLHAGNVLIWPDGRLGLLDFGNVGRLDAGSRRNLGLLLWSVDADDPVLATDAVLDLLDHENHVDERNLQRAIGEIIARMRAGQTGSTISFFQQLLDVVMRHGMSVPRQIAIAMRAMGTLEGTLRRLYPQLDLVASARKQAREQIGNLDFNSLKYQLANKVVRLLPLIENLPSRVNRISEELESGRFTINTRMLAHPDDRAFMTGLANQIVVAALAGFAVIGAVLLITAEGGPLLYGLRVFDLLGYLLGFAGFILALRSVAMVFGRRT